MDQVHYLKAGNMPDNAILSIKPLEFMWPVSNPFLFCAHHLDLFPPGNDGMAPDPALLKGRKIGQDFNLKDGWRMYHGETIPGFPVHPHRGFETITIVKDGFVDHSDSHGQAGRYGAGDVQWMTAGSGLQHSEMFPLLNKENGNRAELFQVWLNLPKAKKMADPYFKMLWSEDIPVFELKDENGKKTQIHIIAGEYQGKKSLPPAPDSWASQPENEVGIWTITMEAGAEWTIPLAGAGTARNLYFHEGKNAQIGIQKTDAGHAIELDPAISVTVKNGDSESRFLLLQGKPIQEPIVQYGPFVMNTQGEIIQAMKDYQFTEFGGWPWPRRDQVHSRDKGRFARHRDGSEEIR